MAADITDHRRTMEELLVYRVPPPPYVPPRRRADCRCGGSGEEGDFGRD
ncbi:MAG TPA: hypothetical protein VNJ09_00955 [Chthonomonadales bacterium]|nr:hypothetical protein [Chthonomonadales bacterium]